MRTALAAWRRSPAVTGPWSELGGSRFPISSSLRERREEIPILLRHFLHMYGRQSSLPCRSVTAAVMEFAKRHDWPGNVRELENFAKRYLALGAKALADGNARQL